MGGLSDLNGSRLSVLLHAGRQVNSVAQGAVFHSQIRTHGPHHHQARVYPHPDINVNTPFLLNLLPVFFNPLLDIQP